jgi:uncharacterized protein (DUF305 family)
MRINRVNRVTRAIGATMLTAALALTVTACGDDDSGSDTGASTEVSTTKHNAADVTFASDMLQHHAQALSMVDLTMGRTLDPEVQQLAEQIREAQAPEIETFTDWLTDWDEKIPETMRDHTNGDQEMGDSMDGMDTDMPGMMSAEDMTALENAPDADFQTMWLEMMVKHHEGAVEMAKTEQEDGQYRAAVDLAADIVDSQSGEIETMKALLGS